ncbi:MAG: hypothetical protein KF910_12660 [Brevundimonas sp.]|uniref:hypothetical protein n=1 Tax=Brevundimonas sp. TaxID=1871086 RepID=UPI0025C488C6|nr:hypothetical protein [Brevundimonas sp.]MBX3478456.1 hypothetical protein [Brevundimonas sp.]
MRMLRAATLMTPDPEATARRYGQWLDYQTVETGLIDADLAAAWGSPAMAGRRQAVCRPASGADLFLRFVEGTAPAGYRPLRTHGWAATEICVQDVLAVHERMARPDSPFRVIGPPRRLDGMAMIHAMQVRGPDGEIVYLTQIEDDPPGMTLPRAAGLIDTVFIMVMACSDLTASKAWVEATLGVQTTPTMDIRYTMLAQAFDLPVERKHPIAMALHEGDGFLELDQYPAEAAPRPRRPGELFPGVALTTFLHPDLSAVRADWSSPPAPHPGTLYGGRPAGVLTGPDGTMIELVQA